MKYVKQPLSIEQQIAKLKSRRLVIDNDEIAADYLSNISYYRLRAYTFPFQYNDDEDKDHQFKRNDLRFGDIIKLYCFDRRLRSLVFNAIEKIEISVRTKIVQQYSLSTEDSHWFYNGSLFRNGGNNENSRFEGLMDDVWDEVGRSNEDFIIHYRRKYSEPDIPPAWMTLEVISFGTLSRLYKLLEKDDDKKSIAKQFGLNDINTMENWLHALSNLRNCCAHHSRIWNRRFPVQIRLPYNTDHSFIDRETIKTIHRNKIFALLSCIKYFLDIISPDSDFKKNLVHIMSEAGSLLTLKDMWFPDNWKFFGVWKEK